MKTILLMAGLLLSSALFAQKTGTLTVQFHNVVGTEDVVLKDEICELEK